VLGWGWKRSLGALDQVVPWALILSSTSWKLRNPEAKKYLSMAFSRSKTAMEGSAFNLSSFSVMMLRRRAGRAGLEPRQPHKQPKAHSLKTKAALMHP